MARYYVNNNAQANGDHEVHELGCTFMPPDDLPPIQAPASQHPIDLAGPGIHGYP